MRIKTIVSGVAVALALSAGSAFAAEQFATLEGVTVEPMNAVELDSVRGMDVLLGGLNLPVLDPTIAFRVAIFTTGAPAVGGDVGCCDIEPPGPDTPTFR